MHCPSCDSQAVTIHAVGRLADFVAYRTGVPAEQGKTCTCGSCGLRFCSVRWTDDQAAALYRGYRDATYDAERSRFEPGYASGYLNAPREYIGEIEALLQQGKQELEAEQANAQAQAAQAQQGAPPNPMEEPQ